LCLYLLKGLLTHSIDHMNAVRWRFHGGQFVYGCILMAIPIFGHGWAIFKWSQRRYMPMLLSLVLAYAVPLTLLAVEGELRWQAIKSSEARQ
jgi:hypothetical protein